MQKGRHAGPAAGRLPLRPNEACPRAMPATLACADGRGSGRAARAMDPPDRDRSGPAAAGIAGTGRADSPSPRRFAAVAATAYAPVLDAGRRRFHQIPVPNPLSIVVVEPDPDRARLIAEALERAGGARVHILGSGSGLARAIATQNPDIVIADVADPS